LEIWTLTYPEISSVSFITFVEVETS